MVVEETSREELTLVVSIIFLQKEEHIQHVQVKTTKQGKQCKYLPPFFTRPLSMTARFLWVSNIARKKRTFWWLQEHARGRDTAEGNDGGVKLARQLQSPKVIKAQGHVFKTWRHTKVLLETWRHTDVHVEAEWYTWGALGNIRAHRVHLEYMECRRHKGDGFTITGECKIWCSYA